jgi:hypothetical protein
MPTIEDYIEPKFVWYEEGSTLARDDSSRYLEFGGSNTRRWRIPPQEGYNAQNPTVTPIKVDLNNPEVTLRPRFIK